MNPRVSEDDLRQVIEDMREWSTLGSFIIPEARDLLNLCQVFLDNMSAKHNPDISSLSDSQIARLVNLMFNGPTEAIRESAQRFLQDHSKNRGQNA